MLYFLIGPMGTGKSTLGSATATYLEWDFLDLDEAIESYKGRSVREIFAEEGEAAFRTEEGAALTRLPNQVKGPTIVATGGGTPCFGDHLARMKTMGKVIYLQTSVETLATRLAPATAHRPLLKGLDEGSLRLFLAEMLERRRVFYEQADHILPEASQQPEQLAQLMLDHPYIAV